MLLHFLKGAILGFSVAAPVGPIGLLCIRRSLALGPMHGFATGLGAATADAVYGAIAGFGLTFISTFLIAQQAWAKLIGGLFLGYLGIKIFLSAAPLHTTDETPSTIANSYFSSLFLTITNPLTILSFMAAFAGLGLANSSTEYTSAALMVGGVFLGSALWWMVLSGISGTFRTRISARGMMWINRISGSLICAFAAAALVSLATSF